MEAEKYAAVILGALVIVIIAVLTYIAFLAEKRNWNGGTCPDCGVRWRSTSTDSSGANGYVCPSCKKTIYVSFGNIDKDAKN